MLRTRINHALTRDTALTAFVLWWHETCDHVLGRRDEWMALCWIVERVLLMLAGLLWLWHHTPTLIGAMFSGIMLLPLVVKLRHKAGQAHLD